ncbi:hypothetical protein KCP71_17460 [Salmonella enterica subsp. enterica]|nr:hypothetical protein KCP71_17460 [Salmonella enterica subsp. enterica]
MAFRRCCRDEVRKKHGSGWTPLPKHGRWTTTRRNRIRRARTRGPVASVAMITRDGRSWNEFDRYHFHS